MITIAFALATLSVVYYVRGEDDVADLITELGVRRVAFAGRLYWLFPSWVAAALLLGAAYWWNVHSRATRLALCVGMAIACLPSLFLGSRAGALPLIVAFLLMISRSALVATRSTPRRETLRVVWALLLLAALASIFGAAKVETSGTSRDFVSPTWANDSILGEVVIDALNQAEDADALAYVVHIARAGDSVIPTGPEVASRWMYSPLMLVPSALVETKPVPYDVEVRESLYGGEQLTGLPASVVGELWLAGEALAVVAGGFVFGFVLRRVGGVLVAATRFRATSSALIMGTSYLLFSRPIVISISRVLAFLLAAAVAEWIWRAVPAAVGRGAPNRGSPGRSTVVR